MVEKQIEGNKFTLELKYLQSAERSKVLRIKVESVRLIFNVLRTYQSTFTTVDILRHFVLSLSDKKKSLLTDVKFDAWLLPSM